MERQPHLTAIARTQGALSWPALKEAFASEEEYGAQRERLAALLSREPVTVLPEAGTPEFLERPGSPASDTGDPLLVYWSDLARRRPTTRSEELVLARVVDLLRLTLVRLLGKRPPAAALALVQEHLSPWSPVLEEIQRRRLAGVNRPLRPALRDLVHQRLAELRAAQHALVARNLHLVPATAHRYRNLGVPLEDLLQEGNTALLRAVERFDRNHGVRFSSYAAWWVRQGILKALSFQSRTVRLPVYLAQALHRVREAQATTPETMEVEVLAAETRVDPERVARALRADRSCVSLDQAAGQEAEEARLRDIIPDERPVAEPDQPGRAELRSSLTRLITCLPPREAQVLRLRYGWSGGRPWTLDRIAQKLGVSRERVRQLQAQALRRLSGPTRRRELARFV